MKRFVSVAALVTGAALFCLPAQAQTGTSSQSTINSGAGASGNVGTTGTMPRSTGSSTGATMGGTAGTTNSTGMSSQGGTMSGHSGTMSGSSSTGSQSGTMGAQSTARGSAAGGMGYQAQATGGSHRMHRGDAAERQMTQCLNNAAAQHQPLSSCQR
jgi:hypothetical protein